MLSKNYALRWYNEIRAAAQGDAASKLRIRDEEARRRVEELPPLLDEVARALRLD